MTKVFEHDHEPVRGLPENLPEGERILWQGAPDWMGLARRAFHAPAAAMYSGVLMLAFAAGELLAGKGALAAFASAAALLPFAVLGVGLLAGLAWLNARSTVYTITNRRVVMRIGAALTKAINIPFRQIGSADVNVGRDGCGDISVTLSHNAKIPYAYLWPHARPFLWREPRPALRGVKAPNEVAAILAEALKAYQAEAPEAARETALATPSSPVPTPTLATAAA